MCRRLNIQLNSKREKRTHCAAKSLQLFQWSRHIGFKIRHNFFMKDSLIYSAVEGGELTWLTLEVVKLFCMEMRRELPIHTHQIHQQHTSKTRSAGIRVRSSHHVRPSMPINYDVFIYLKELEIIKVFNLGLNRGKADNKGNSFRAIFV